MKTIELDYKINEPCKKNLDCPVGTGDVSSPPCPGHYPIDFSKSLRALSGRRNVHSKAEVPDDLFTPLRVEPADNSAWEFVNK